MKKLILSSVFCIPLLVACGGSGEDKEAPVVVVTEGEPVAKPCIDAVIDASRYDGPRTQKDFLAIVKEIDGKMLVGHKAGDEISGHLCKVNEDSVEIQAVRLLNGVDTSGYEIRTYSIDTGKRVLLEPFDYAEVIIDNFNAKPNSLYSDVKLLTVYGYPFDHIVTFLASAYFYHSEIGKDLPVNLEFTYDKNIKNLSFRRL